jgi:two-component system NtrC family sensor kinase
MQALIWKVQATTEMSDKVLTYVMLVLDAAFPAERLKAPLVLALFSTWLACAVFAQLARHTHKSHFQFWAVAWLFYSMYLLASMRLGEWYELPLLVMLRQACIGVSAVCMFWGGLESTGHMRHQRELGLGLGIMLAWSYVAAYRLPDRTWNTIPAFVLLALASGYVGVLFLKQRTQCRGATLLTVGFALWALYLLGFAFLNSGHRSVLPGFIVAGYLVGALLALWIALGMVMLSLEQAHERNDTLLSEFKKGITQRRLLEQEVSLSEQKYRVLFDSASDAIFLVDLSNFEIVDANESAAQLIGVERKAVTGNSFAKLCLQLSQAHGSLLENKKLVEDMLNSSSEFSIRREDGGQALCEGSANLVQYQKRPVLQINAREVTERKKMEQQLRQAEKLTALGQLVAGVAHELNNPLAVVMGYAQILSQHGNLEEKVRKDLLKILHERDRAAKIVRNLLTFARPREPHMVAVDVNRLVSDALETREIQLSGANVRVVRRLANGLPRTMADPNQIEQVLANLVGNAVQALANHPVQRVIETFTEHRNGKIRITIADNGPGIPVQVLNKIFDPFFTTKGPGSGTGLGLSICYSIVEEHKGKIWVETEVGRGSRFFVELPVVACRDQVDDPIVASEEHTVDPQASRRRLLIVDDEPGIVEVLKEVLGSGGYCIETASNGAEALARLASQSYDLILSDLCMPEMSGEKFYQALSARFPHMRDRIIFVTGDTVSPHSRQFLEETGARWLSKPFNIREIEKIVIAALRDGESTAEPVMSRIT